MTSSVGRSQDRLIIISNTKTLGQRRSSQKHRRTRRLARKAIFWGTSSFRICRGLPKVHSFLDRSDTKPYAVTNLAITNLEVNT
jgi:hypothetical protein